MHILKNTEALPLPEREGRLAAPSASGDGSKPSASGTTEAQNTAILTALARIHDPCSVAAGRPTSLLDMNLALGWDLRAGHLHVRFAVTFAGCTMAPHFTQAARDALLGVPGVEAVTTEVDTSHVWTPAALPAPPMRGEPQAWRRRAAGAAA